MLLANPGSAFVRITEMDFFLVSDTNHSKKAQILFKLTYSKRQTPRISQMKLVPFVNLLCIISHYSVLLDIVVQVTPCVACIPFSRVTPTFCSCVYEFYFFLKRIQDETATFSIKALFSIVKEKGHT